ncbi:MAG: MGMT family protein [Nanoarchaeota archaeon]
MEKVRWGEKKSLAKRARFAERVYSLCKGIPKGKVTTYKELGRALEIKGYQAIGQVLRCSPGLPLVPCHRVVKSDGSLGGFKGKTGGKEVEEKRGLLAKEGINSIGGKINLNKYLHHF